MRAHRPVARIALVKGGWAIVGGALLLLTVFGDRVFRIGDSGDAGIGVLYAARGIGAAIGSFTVTALARRVGDTADAMDRTVVPRGRRRLRDARIRAVDLVRGAHGASSRTRSDRSSGSRATCCCR